MDSPMRRGLKGKHRCSARVPFPLGFHGFPDEEGKVTSTGLLHRQQGENRSCLGLNRHPIEHHSGLSGVM